MKLKRNQMIALLVLMALIVVAIILMKNEANNIYNLEQSTVVIPTDK